VTVAISRQVVLIATRPSPPGVTLKVMTLGPEPRPLGLWRVLLCRARPELCKQGEHPLTQPYFHFR